MKLLDILKEVIDEEIRRKEKLNKRGMFKSVYNFETKPDYVLKTWGSNRYSKYMDDDNMVKREYDVFQKHPDLFANIIKVNWDKKWMAQEKLDSDKASNELEDLSDYFDMTASELTTHLEWASSDPETLAKDYSMLYKIDPSKATLYDKWTDFFRDIKRINIQGYKDFNPGNFGYDKSGHLKLLDI
jgi:hypothetical protein